MKRAREKASSLTLKRFIDWAGASTLLPRAVQERSIRGAGNDSRTVGAGEVFVALATEKDDGHRYVVDALRRGAVAALVEKKKLPLFSPAQQKRLIAVSDPLGALQRIAAEYRKTLSLPVVGITGSSGKTTARTFVAGVLRRGMKVGETAGNLNNHIGVPMSLLRFTGNEDVGVLEMGANHTREIHLLSTIARPTIGVITSIGYAHIGYFGSLRTILRAKLEIIDGMHDPSGFLMLNGDDRLLAHAARGIRKQTVLFGFSPRCAVRARNVRVTDRETGFEVDGHPFRLAAAGRHFVYSALLAIHLGRHFGMDSRSIADALSTIEPATMRGTITEKRGVTFIVDCYNANPSSMKSGIELLTDVAGSRPKVAVVGDMLELGKYSRSLHVGLGGRLARAGVRAIVAVGAFAESVADGARKAGMRKKDIHIAPDSRHALTPVSEVVRKGDVVLVKGSRGVHLETIFEGFSQEGAKRNASAR
jgi:UDP-N-acetylmuramoyl-tripeptide--D-alanyl-D-alanine ligase